MKESLATNRRRDRAGTRTLPKVTTDRLCTVKLGGLRPRLNESELAIIRRALVSHEARLRHAVDKCVGSLWPSLYAGEAADTRALLKRFGMQVATLAEVDPRDVRGLPTPIERKRGTR